MEAILRFGQTAWEFIVQHVEALDMLITGWAELPSQFNELFLKFGPAGDVFTVLICVCGAMIALRLITIIIELIPGF